MNLQYLHIVKNHSREIIKMSYQHVITMLNY